MKAYGKDIKRTIGNGKKRFFSIMAIVMLGVTVGTGIKAACDDLLYSADLFYDRQNLYDISVQSTLGLTEKDVAALTSLEGVEYAEGFYSESVHTKINDINKSAEVKLLSETSMNQPYIIEGKLPEKVNEIAVTENYLSDSGKNIGDTLIIEEERDSDEKEIDESSDENKEEDSDASSSTFSVTEYTITASVIDPTSVNRADGATAFRSSLDADYIFFVTPEAADTDIYTAVYLKISDGQDLVCYADEYDEKVDNLTNVIAAEVKAAQEQARTDEIYQEASDKIADAERTMNEEFAKADAEIADARKEIADAYQELEAGEQELADAKEEAEKEFQKAWNQIMDSKKELQDGEKALADAQKELDTGEQELAEGKNELDASKKQLIEAQQQIEAGEEQLAAGKAELTQQEADAMAQIASGRNQIQEGKATVESNISEIENNQLQPIISQFGEAWPAVEWEAYRRADESALPNKKNVFLQKLQPIIDGYCQNIDAQLSMLDETDPANAEMIAQLQQQKAAFQALPDQLVQLADGLRQLDAALADLNEQERTLDTQEEEAKAQFAAAWAEISKNEAELAAGREQLESGWAEWESGSQKLEIAEQELEAGKKQIKENQSKISSGWTELNEGIAELEKQEADANQKIRDGYQELEDGRVELEDAEKELAENVQEYEQERADAEKEVSDEKAKLDDLDSAKWYIQNRNNLSGYDNISTDSAAIASIGTVFPLIFLIIAILISLTTINRMVEEDRGLIGTYQALGFTDGEIRKKYIIYALCACAAGGILGNLCGYIILPEIVFIFFKVMYLIPSYHLSYNVMYGLGNPLLFIAAVLGAVWATCNAALRRMPAELMRPKSPKAGSRVLLERIGWLWNRFSFLNKVTARNLFRYKKRLFMTVFGICGCTALLICGFAISDSVKELVPRQYDQIHHFEVMAVTADDDNEKLVDCLEETQDIEQYLNLRIDTVTMKNEAGDTISVQMYVIPEGQDIESYIHAENIENGSTSIPDNKGILVTRNASMMLNFEAADQILVQDMSLNQYEFHVSGVIENYMSNFILITQELYEDVIGNYEANAALAILQEDADKAKVVDELGKHDWVQSVMSTEDMKEEFSTVFDLVNIVVYIMIVLAAGLAFIVLFTLANTNISERERELATIKVLGFYDKEVHSYVNKETMILTLIGILLGIPVGTLLGHSLTYVLKMPSVYFAVTIYPISYVISAALSLIFALIVNMITNKVLNKIDPVEALKSIE